MSDLISDPTTHELKVWPPYFDALLSGVKTFEFRRDDREPRFAVGDVLWLREWGPDGGGIGSYSGSGRECYRRVTYVARDGVIPAGFCVMSIESVAPSVSSSAPPPTWDEMASMFPDNSKRANRPRGSSAEPAPPTVGGKYRKKPVVIDAIQWTGRNPMELGMWRGQWPRTFPDFNIHPDTLEIDILELEDGHDRRVKHVASVGDYIIRGIQGEFYACKPDIFTATYESVTP